MTQEPAQWCQWLPRAARWLMPTPGVFAPSKLGISRSAHSVPRCCARAHAISDGLVAPRAACEWQGKENKSHREQWHARRQYNDHLALQGTADPFDHGGEATTLPSRERPTRSTMGEDLVSLLVQFPRGTANRSRNGRGARQLANTYHENTLHLATLLVQLPRGTAETDHTMVEERDNWSRQR